MAWGKLITSPSITCSFIVLWAHFIVSFIKSLPQLCCMKHSTLSPSLMVDSTHPIAERVLNILLLDIFESWNPYRKGHSNQRHKLHRYRQKPDRPYTKKMEPQWVETREEERNLSFFPNIIKIENPFIICQNTWFFVPQLLITCSTS